MTVLQFWTHFDSLDGTQLWVSMRVTVIKADTVYTSARVQFRAERVRARKLCPDRLFESLSHSLRHAFQRRRDRYLEKLEHISYEGETRERLEDEVCACVERERE